MMILQKKLTIQKKIQAKINITAECLFQAFRICVDKGLYFFTENAFFVEKYLLYFLKKNYISESLLYNISCRILIGFIVSIKKEKL